MQKKATTQKAWMEAECRTFKKLSMNSVCLKKKKEKKKMAF